MNELIKIIENFKKKKILVIGDVMLDKYIWGSVTRISPEAPVQIVEVKKESFVPGGAANAANNIAALDAQVFIVGVVGNDQAKEHLVHSLRKNNIETEFITDAKRPTIRKVRIMGQNQQLLRVDYENKEFIEEDIEAKVIERVTKLLKVIDAVLISDYNKGLMTKKITEWLIKACNESEKPVVVDTKSLNKEFFRNSTLITPNHDEASRLTGIEEKTEDDVIKIGNKLMTELNCNVMITRGAKGMLLFTKEGKITEIQTKARQVFDVTGAGDTVSAVMTLGLASGINLRDAAKIANYAAGVVVGKVGTATVSAEELSEAINSDKE
jgi:rfaE bifunctional protein kinase chain/domain